MDPIETASPSDTGASGTTDAAPSSATNGDSTNGSETAPGAVPYPRFKEVVEQRNTLQTQFGDLLARVDQLLARTETPAGPPALPKIPEIPEGLSPIDKVAFVAQHAAMDKLPAWFKEQYGVELKDVVEAAKAVPSMSRTSAEQKWEAICRDNNVDPNNQDFQAAVHGFVLGAKLSVPEAVAKVKGLFRLPDSRPAATALDSGISAAMIAEDAFPRNARQAHDLARQGKRVANLTVEEIFARGAQKS